MRFSIFAVAGLLLSTIAIAAPVDLSTRSDELLDSDDILFAREPANPPSRIPRYVGAAAIRRPRAPTPRSMRSNTLNRPPMSPSPSPPRTPSPRPPRRPSRIPIRRGSNLRGRSDDLEDEMFSREPDLSTRSDELLDSDDILFAREPAIPPSRIPRWGGAAARQRLATEITRPRAPTPRSMRTNSLGSLVRPSRIPLRRGSNLRGRSDELEDEVFAREPANPRSRIPRYVGAAAIRRPRAPTPRSMRSNTLNRPPMSPSPSPPRTPSPRPPRRPSRIPIRRGSNLRGRSDEIDSE